jgi:hypothetical protein
LRKWGEPENPGLGREDRYAGAEPRKADKMASPGKSGRLSAVLRCHFDYSGCIDSVD